MTIFQSIITKLYFVMINAFYCKKIAFFELVHLIKEIAEICNVHR